MFRALSLGMELNEDLCVPLETLQTA